MKKKIERVRYKIREGLLSDKEITLIVTKEILERILEDMEDADTDEGIIPLKLA